MSEVIEHGTPTPRLGLTKPTVDDDIDIWGDLTNANWDLLDQALLTSGGTLTGALLLYADPTQALEAATKHYVDTVAAAYLPLTGGTLTGALGVKDSATIFGDSASPPVFTFTQTSAPLDQKNIQLFEDGSGNLIAQFANDVFSAATAFLNVYRNGYAVTGLTLTAPQITLAGNVSCNGPVAANSFAAEYGLYPYAADTSFALLRSGTSRALTWYPGYSMQWAESGGTLAWYGNNAGIMSLDPNGNLWLAGNLACTVSITCNDLTANNAVYPYAGDKTFALFRTGNGTRLLQWASGYYAGWTESNGEFSWVGNNVGLMSLDGGGNLWCANNGEFGNEVQCNGMGVRYLNICPNGFNFRWGSGLAYIRIDNAVEIQIQPASDERLKAEIAPSTFDCLAAIVALPLFQFRWRSFDETVSLENATLADDAPLVPIGFVAQRDYAAFPDAVLAGGEADKGTAGAATLWQMNHNTLAAALCGAVQQLNARLVALEAA